MAHRDPNQKEVLLGDVPGDEEKVRAILARWGVEETSIRRLMREHRRDTAGARQSKDDARAPRPRKHADA